VPCIYNLFISLFFLMPPPPPTSTLFPYTTLFRSDRGSRCESEPALAARQVLGCRNRGVSDGGPCARHDQLELETRFEVGLVEAGESGAGIRRNEKRIDVL